MISVCKRHIGSAFFLAALTSGIACADCIPARVSEIAPGVYLRSGTHGVMFEQTNVANIGFVVGDRCVAVIDTGGSHAEGEALRCALAQVTSRPVCYVINTHSHPDHMLGNLAFRSTGAQFVGHVNLTRALALTGATYLQRAAHQAGRPLGAEHIVPPTLQVSTRHELLLGGRALHVTAHPPAHTDHDLTVYDPHSATLWLGDLLFREHIPVLAGSITGWLRQLEELARLPARRAIPGHGQVGEWPSAAADLRRYLTGLRDETRVWLAKGGDLRGAQDTLGGSERDAWLLFDEYHRRNVAAAFLELEWED
ncbi:MAG: quinoprotein relay system zinc metallohydrolase 2 [Gammaproteobacteria bacterium]|nr:quinoprotein relay system zinc metallohydrolase 2 [Gammaproteobacteria bacterium]